MLDAATHVENMQTVNSVSGTISRTHPNSYFMIGHATSEATKSLIGKGKRAIILQAMLIGDKYLMYEVIDREDIG